MQWCQPSDASEDTSRAIDRELQSAKKKLSKQVSLLLLGPGESGKSTLFKQIRLINSTTWDGEEREDFKLILRGNLLSQLRLLSAVVRLEVTGELAAVADRLLNDAPAAMVAAWTPQLVADMKEFLRAPAVQTAIKTRASELQLLDSLPYLLEHADRICKSDFLPTDDDIMRVRKMTTSVVEMEWETNGTPFKLVDVGGQRSQRSKWIHFFAGVDAVLFVLALSDYDMVLREDATTNRMTEALSLFTSLVNSKWFGNTDFIIFFNKNDTFTQKAKTVDLSVCWPEYTGGLNPDAAREYIKKKFLREVMPSQNSKGAERRVYPHYTCATDTNQIKKIWATLRDSVVMKTLDARF